MKVQGSDMKETVTEPKETKTNCTNDAVTQASGHEIEEMSVVRSLHLTIFVQVLTLFYSVQKDNIIKTFEVAIKFCTIS